MATTTATTISTYEWWRAFRSDSSATTVPPVPITSSETLEIYSESRSEGHDVGRPPEIVHVSSRRDQDDLVATLCFETRQPVADRRLLRPGHPCGNRSRRLVA